MDSTSAAAGCIEWPEAGPSTPAPAQGWIRPHPAQPFAVHRICRIEHDLHRHPLMQLPELQRLAHEIQPRGGCRFMAPGAALDSAFLHADASHQGLGLDEVFARIEEKDAWIALYNVESVERYRRMLHEAVGSMRERVEREQPGIYHVTGFIFISAPPSVTPFHIDRENNFWLQIRGRKVLGVWEPTDRVSVPASSVEEFIVHRDLSGVRLRDEIRSRCLEFDSGPGDGVYFPSTTPHMTRATTDWVKPGDGVSISIGVNFYTRTTRRHAQVHQANRLLRRLGLEPRMPGESAWRDRLKAPLGRAVLEVLRRRGKGYVVPPGMV